MKTLNNIFRKTLPAIAIASCLGLGLTSCGQADAANTEAPALAEFAPAVKSITEEAPDSTANIEESIEILRAEACTGVEAYEPVGASSEFDREVGKVWIYTKVKMPKGENSTINHTYFRNGKQIQTVNLKVKGPTFRTRSYKTIHKGMHGDWKVEITTAGGKLIDTVNFSVE